jgi:hypothetical protein
MGQWGFPAPSARRGLIRHEVAANPRGTGPPADWVGGEPAGMTLGGARDRTGEAGPDGTWPAAG